MTLRASVGVQALIVVVALLASTCGSSKLKEAPPLPDLANVEAAVVQKIRRLHDAMTDSPTAGNWAAYARTLHAHDMAEATEAYVVAAAHSPMPDKFDLLYLAGLSCIKRDPDRAIALLEEARELKDDYFPLHIRLARLYEKAQRAPEARRHFKRAHAITPSSLALVGMGRLSLIDGRIDEAIAHLEAARAMAPNHPEVHAALADAYTRAGRKQDAAHASSLVGDIEREFGFPDPLMATMAREGVSLASLEQFGIAALRGSEFAQALDAFDRALAVQPDSLGVLRGRAQALVGLNRCAEAEPILDRVLAKKPDDAELLTFRAGCSMARNDLAGALASLRRAVAIDPSHADARWNLARTLRALSQNAEARRHLEVVLERKPHKTEARILLASILSEEGSTGEAMTHLQQVLAQEPANSQALELRKRLTER